MLIVLIILMIAGCFLHRNGNSREKKSESDAERRRLVNDGDGKAHYGASRIDIERGDAAAGEHAQP